MPSWSGCAGVETRVIRRHRQVDRQV